MLGRRRIAALDEQARQAKIAGLVADQQMVLADKALADLRADIPRSDEDALRIAKLQVEIDDQRAKAANDLYQANTKIPDVLQQQGMAGYFLKMLSDAKTPMQIAQDGITSSVDQLSGSLADAATGKKGNFGKDFQEIGRQILQESIKSGLQRSLGSLGQKPGIHKPTFNIGDPGHVIVDNMPSNGSAAPGGIKPATGSGGSRPWGGPGGIFGGSAGGGIFNYAGGGPSFSSSPFGGMMADGGDVDPGMIYGVNDGDGREYFQPKTAGTIIPAGKFGGGGDTHYNIDARGSTDPTLTANNVRRAILAAHADGVATSVQANAERAKRTVQA